MTDLQSIKTRFGIIGNYPVLNRALQKAIQVASKIRHHISEDLFVMYAYYASDNPLETGSTLSSGGLGLTGVKPTYLITLRILEKILKSGMTSKK